MFASFKQNSFPFPNWKLGLHAESVQERDFLIFGAMEVSNCIRFFFPLFFLKHCSDDLHLNFWDFFLFLLMSKVQLKPALQQREVCK